MATIKQMVVEFLEGAYKQDPTRYKFSALEILEGVQKKYPYVKKSSLAPALTSLRTNGTLTVLEKIPGGNSGAKYVALTTILDEVTRPKNDNNEGGEKNVANQENNTKGAAMAKKPSEIAVAANPFDKVNSRLDELIAKVNGLAQGYADLAKRELPTTNNGEVIDLLNKIQTAVAEPVVVDSKIADTINERLTSYVRDDSLIYRVREEMDDRIRAHERELKKAIKGIQIPPEFATLSDDEKYQKGIRDGIKLAVEMGLVLPDA